MNGFGLLLLLLGVFHDIAEESEDWEENQEPEQVGSWTIAGLAILFTVSVLLSLLLSRWLQASIDVPFNLYSLGGTEASSVTFYGFVSDIFGTWFSVVPGEENMKNICIVFHKVYEDSSIADVPYYQQPARLLGNAIWSVEHVIRGQHQLPFIGSVFVSGIGMDAVTARTGTPLTSWLIHAIFNSIVLTSSFLMEGFLTVIPS